MNVQDEIKALRAGAAALVEDTAEPCWGLAQRLSEIAERLVSEAVSSGAYPACFAPPAPALLCLACGRAGGHHENWCIHAHEHVTTGACIDSDVPDVWLDPDIWGAL